ncbi:hypothetical protein DICPUDRAFT_88483 [Dictyostelium purpureum]|uniref:Dolichol kinase n=1 Tax=Dictyostelium purpureum TaxID=5786 RepID=F0ZPP7_DICPU|nr:uncharacterized protein DICPUDRAFT_88483 [Dictyostelium purpureum]EGC34089.1 hypothetical protein DICPUDRAFT_88483 [Dictyostelium purpureum]|eukprot:XP_003289382.1 hypothetical protein DICPUDRAFT_88483 [Dictyostelium purpureum]
MQQLVIPFLQSSMICLSILKTIQFLKDKNIVSSEISRKMIHTAIGMVYTISWRLYPDSYYSRFIMGMVPAVFAFQFSLIGLGIIHDPKTVNSMSRSGKPSELLKGPVAYGLLIAILTMYYWFDSPIGLISILILSIGDGCSAITGILYGKRRLPYNRSKTYVGTTGFFICSFIGTYIILNILSSFLVTPVVSIVPSLFITCMVSAFVESLPFFAEWDNVTVTLASILTLKTLGW